MSDNNVAEEIPEQQDRPARERRRSRYDRPRSQVSWFGLILGLVLGVGGGIFYAWNVAPVEEYDTAPWQLREQDLAHYVVAIMMQYSYDGDLGGAIQSVIDLRLDGSDPIQQVADIACDLARTGYVDSNSGRRAIRVMMAFYQGQGKSSCADALIPAEDTVPTQVVQVVLPTATLVPPASKTPTPEGALGATATPPPLFAPTATPQRAFTLVGGYPTFCSTELSGIIEVRVRDFNGQEIPGQPIRVRWSDGESTFFTGLKPERGPGYADFEMEPGREYIIEMPGLSDPSDRSLIADDCFTESGEEAIRSYRIVFQGS
jgi:hypothetical protein